MGTCVRVYVCIRMCVHVCVYTCMFVHVYVCTRVCSCVCMCVHVYVCTCVCIHVYVCIIMFVWYIHVCVVSYLIYVHSVRDFIKIINDMKNRIPGLNHLTSWHVELLVCVGVCGATRDVGYTHPTLCDLCSVHSQLNSSLCSVSVCISAFGWRRVSTLHHNIPVSSCTRCM